VKLSDLKEGLYGKPDYMKPEDDHEFVLGPGKELSKGCVFREVRQQDQWQLANYTFKKGAALVVSDERGKSNSLRTWNVMPTNDMPGRGVVLMPLHDNGTFFRGTRAHAVSPLILASGLKPIIAHLKTAETFNRVSVAVESGKGWGDVSRWLSLLHNFAFIEPTYEPTLYEEDDPMILALKSDKDRLHAPGSKMNYRKTATWDSLIRQWEEFLKSGLKTMECAP
jgi:hypothetical protein